MRVLVSVLLLCLPLQGCLLKVLWSGEVQVAYVEEPQVTQVPISSLEVLELEEGRALVLDFSGNEDLLPEKLWALARRGRGHVLLVPLGGRPFWLGPVMPALFRPEECSVMFLERGAGSGHFVVDCVLSGGLAREDLGRVVSAEEVLTMTQGELLPQLPRVENGIPALVRSCEDRLAGSPWLKLFRPPAKTAETEASPEVVAGSGLDYEALAWFDARGQPLRTAPALMVTAQPSSSVASTSSPLPAVFSKALDLSKLYLLAAASPRLEPEVSNDSATPEDTTYFLINAELLWSSDGLQVDLDLDTEGKEGSWQTAQSFVVLPAPEITDVAEASFGKNALPATVAEVHFTTFKRVIEDRTVWEKILLTPFALAIDVSVGLFVYSIEAAFDKLLGIDDEEDGERD